MTRRALLQVAKKIGRPRGALPRMPHALPTDMAPVALWFHALSDVTRLAIVEMLSHRERCVCELQHVLDAEQSLLSFHLKVLKEAGIVRDRREGRWMYYGLDPTVLEQIAAFTRSVKPGKHAGTCPLDCCQ